MLSSISRFLLASDCVITFGMCFNLASSMGPRESSESLTPVRSLGTPSCCRKSKVVDGLSGSSSEELRIFDKASEACNCTWVHFAMASTTKLSSLDSKNWLALFRLPKFHGSYNFGILVCCSLVSYCSNKSILRANGVDCSVRSPRPSTRYKHTPSSRELRPRTF